MRYYNSGVQFIYYNSLDIFIFELLSGVILDSQLFQRPHHVYTLFFGYGATYEADIMIPTVSGLSIGFWRQYNNTYMYTFEPMPGQILK